ncbi:MAG: response regulator transcription factor [Clostridia bacterium]|nr:response regulator transcription factor [Clostridia bacterium]
MSFQTKDIKPEVDPSGALILVADDEQDIRTLLRILFEKEGWRVAEAADGEAAIAYVRDHADVSLVVLDIMMPVMDGIKAATALRPMTDAPILFLTARSSEGDKLAAYRSGGDDYIVKPFHAIDLRLKVRAMLQRHFRYLEGLSRTDEADSPIVSPAEGIEVNLHENTVFKNGERVILTDREYELLCFFCRNRQRTLSPAEIYEAVWEEPYLNTASNTVIVHIANLRKKLEISEGGHSFIRTVWGRGYRVD